MESPRKPQKPTCVCVCERERECVACVFWLGLTLIAFFCCCYFPLRPSGDFIVCVFVCRGCFFVLSWLWGSLVCPWLCSIDPRIAVLCHGWHWGVALCWCGETSLPWFHSLCFCFHVNSVSSYSLSLTKSVWFYFPPQ